jgi:tetrahydromethanopterin S-methyltransferase subunit F
MKEKKTTNVRRLMNGIVGAILLMAIGALLYGFLIIATGWVVTGDLGIIWQVGVGLLTNNAQFYRALEIVGIIGFIIGVVFS